MIVGVAMLIWLVDDQDRRVAVEGARDRGEGGGPYGPTMPFGMVQFVGQAALMAGGVYVGRRWLRVRL